ncbi:MAG: low molecular weight phosphatase family protein [Candidatus Methylomirabilaceae bacterium]
MIKPGYRLQVLFVCGGCTCRSPMAAALATSVLAGLADVSSAGVAARFSRRAHPLAVEAMKTHYGMDISAHSPRDARDLDLARYDLLVALDHIVAHELRTRFGVPAEKLLEVEIPDPYIEGTAAAYRTTAMALPALVENVRRLLEGLGASQ